MEDKKLKLSTYLLKCIDFEKNPEDASKLDEINDFLNQIQVREYLPLKEKEILAVEIVTKVSDDYDAPGAAVMLEMGKISEGLLHYCINLDNDVPFSNALYDTYDKIFQYGLYDKILEGCEKDYSRLNALIDEMINVSNLYRIVHTAQFFDDESLDKWEETLKNLKESLDSETLKELTGIVALNDPAGEELLRSIKEMSIENANEQMRKDKEKLNAAIEALENKKEEEEE